MRVAVAGGTGVVGRMTVAALRRAGHDPVVLARSTGVDLVTGAGVADAMAGAEAVVDVTNVVTTRRRPAVDFFGAVSRQLVDHGAAAGVRHHVVLSIVGVDRVSFGYYDGKRRQEEVALAGPVPATVLRSTQFHEFAVEVLERTPGPISLVPRQRIQPVAAAEVAAELVRLVTGPAQGFAPDLAGPEVHELVDLAKAVARRRGAPRVVIGVRLPGAGGRAMASGALLPRTDGPRGRETFEQWVQRQVWASSGS